MILHFRDLARISVTAFHKWRAKDPFRESAVIAYYSIFSLPGLLVVVTSLAGYFFGRGAVDHHLTEQITLLMGAETAGQIRDMIAKAGESENSIWAGTIGLVTILFGAMGVFTQFQKSLDAIWEVKVDASRSGFWGLVKVRLFSFGLVVTLAFILIASLVISASLSAFGSWLSGHFSAPFYRLLQGVHLIVTLVVLTALFALIFKVLPDAKVRWWHVWIGSFVTAFLFEIGKYGMGLYFGKTNPGLGYGAAGSIILIMLWVSYSSMIVFYGAEFTHAYARLYSGKVPPTEIAQTGIPGKA